ncbi:metallophosphoesterase family protein [Clostridium rectalis]|uniref:metallophosphoesterase family protein n=1 Tax=Clostridium rectalis TaxID=2040295 RepID=UPI000F62D5C6|nr:metallophosphoesterase family protein [Clostridium rectalis]
MRIAVISDIHGNIFALDNVLKDIKDREVDCIINLGDLVGYGSFPNEVVNIIKTNNIISIKGNYDVSVIDNKFSYIRDTEINQFSLPFTVNELTDENKEFIKSLPSKISLKFEKLRILFVHGSHRSINEYLKEDNEEIKEIIVNLREDVLVCAHTHIPYIKKAQNKFIINDGSVGKPKIGRPNPTYGILDIRLDKLFNIEIIEIKYDYKKIMEDMKYKGFPYKLIKSYESGLE